MSISTLYLCYFGLREPLVSTQVLPYLRQLSAAGIKVHLLTFEPRLHETWSDAEITEHQKRLAREGIAWFYLPYHKRPSVPATLYDILVGARYAAKLIRQLKIDVVHARSHVPAMMGALVKRWTGARLIFDIRGFMPEEYVDAGVWPAEGNIYRAVKKVERRLLSSADAFVVLTERAREILFGSAADTDSQGRPIEVIPCCMDAQRFNNSENEAAEDLRRELQLDGRRVIVYLGALGGWYLTDEMAQFLATAHQQDPETFSLILTQSPAEMMSVPLRSLGVPETDYLIRRVTPAEVPRYLRAADISLSFIKTCYSKQASSPTKIAEALASGLPIISNAGIGDLDAMIEGDRVGAIVREFNEDAYLAALDAVDVMRKDKSFAARSRATAVNRFDLATVGGPRYVRLYQRLMTKARG
ncbi:MAG TPA: glycosyltransferase family 4 protein [Pyrinomonadaceae bacterium]|nr:glycosyltransferase family 4 protein [Pyrinomonadaceae bacterium]